MKTKYILTDVEGLVKDSESGAVLNVDNAKLEAYKKRKQQSQSNNNRIERLEQSVDDIKKMLEQLLKR